MAAPKRHPHPAITKAAVPSIPPQAPLQPTSQAPLETIFSDNIEFTLLSAVGSAGAQTITMTVLLKTSAANWQIGSHVESIIDTEGNEYKLITYALGASTHGQQIKLTTGVSIKCTYTFGGIQGYPHLLEVIC